MTASPSGSAERKTQNALAASCSTAERLSGNRVIPNRAVPIPIGGPAHQLDLVDRGPASPHFSSPIHYCRYNHLLLAQQTRNVAGTWQERSKVAGRLRYFGMFLPRSCRVPIRRHSETFVQCSCHVPRDISATFNNNVILWRSYHFPATFNMNVVFGMFLPRSRHIHIERGFGTFQPRSATYQKNVPVTFQNVRDFLTFLSRSCHVQIECGLRTFLPHSKRTFPSCFQTTDFGTFLCHVPVTLKFNVVWKRSFHIKKNIPVTSPQKWFWNVALTHSYHVHKGRDVGTFPPHSKKALLERSSRTYTVERYTSTFLPH